MSTRRALRYTLEALFRQRKRNKNGFRAVRDLQYVATKNAEHMPKVTAEILIVGLDIGSAIVGFLEVALNQQILVVPVFMA